MGTVERVFRHEIQPLDYTRVEKWLRKAEKSNKYVGECTSVAPHRPPAGTVFLYKCANDNDKDYLADGYHGFKYVGNNKRKPSELLKMFYKMEATEEDKIKKPSVAFTKHTYELRQHSNESRFVVLHYLGDHTLGKCRAHGNSASGRNFVRNTQNAKVTAAEKIEGTGKNAKKVFDLCQQELVAKTENFQLRQSTAGLRDVKQVENIKQKLNTEKQILRCDMFSIIEIGRNKTLGDLIIKNVTNRFEATIFAEREVLNFANTLLVKASVDSNLPQLLTYDTTFKLADAYLSALIMRNTYLKNDPIFPVAFMIHSDRTTRTHEEFWSEMKRELHLEVLQDNVPLCTDREPGIANAIFSVFKDVHLVYCHNHIWTDIKHWVKSSRGSTLEDQLGLKSHVTKLIGTESEEEFEQVYENVEQFWAQDFKTYMENNLKDDMKKHSIHFVTKKFAAFKNVAATTNISECMNAIIKQHNDWKELRLDSLVIALFNLQQTYLHRFHRAYDKAGVGSHVLKDEFKNENPPFELPSYTYWPEEEIIRVFKEDVYFPDCNIEKEGLYQQSRMGLAKLTCSKGLVSLDSQSRVFVVTEIYSKKEVLVKRGENGLLECTCGSSGLCYHRLAVCYSTRAELPDSDVCTYALHVLRKKTRPKKGRCGRKPPKGKKAKNVDVIEAPDSDLARRKLELEESITKSPAVTAMNSRKSADGMNERETNAIKNENYSNGIDVIESSGEGTDSIQEGDGSHIEDEGDDGSVPWLTGEEADALADISRVSMEEARDFEVNNESMSETWSDPSFYASTADSIKINAVPSEFPKNFKKMSTLKCLRPHGWLSDDVVNKMVVTIILSNKMQNAVGYVDCNTSNWISKKDFTRVIVNAAISQGLNREIQYIVLNTENHWFAAVVIWKLKEIVLMTSIETCPENKRLWFQKLLTWVAACHYVAEVTFNVDDWKFVVDNGVPRQDNGFDCGLFVCYYIYSIARRERHVSREYYNNSDHGRRWICYAIADKDCNTSIVIKPIKRATKSMKKSIPHLLEKLHLRPIQKYDFVEEARLKAIVDQLRGSTKGWEKCQADNCVATEEDHDTRQVLCVKCRFWFHVTCSFDCEISADYFLCKNCTQYRVSSDDFKGMVIV